MINDVEKLVVVRKDVRLVGSLNLTKILNYWKTGDVPHLGGRYKLTAKFRIIFINIIVIVLFVLKSGLRYSDQF